MQETRQHILEILKERGQATVDDIVKDLRQRRGQITAVTVRHHLNRLQQEKLIATPELRHRTTPGRPQHVYALTEQADDYFPENYQRLLTGLINQLQKQLPQNGINVIIEGVADDMAQEANIPDVPLRQRLDIAVMYLNENGYNAYWESCDKGGYLLHTTNCPYHHLSKQTDMLCNMDMRLITTLVGIMPRKIATLAEGDAACSYLIPTD